MLIYPIAIHKDEDSDYGVTVPDLPGCFSAGSTLDEAIANAGEAVALYLEDKIESGQVLPQPRTIEYWKQQDGFGDATWAVVPVDEHKLPRPVQRVNISVATGVLTRLDQQAGRLGFNRSEFITRAVVSYIDLARSVQAKLDDTEADQPATLRRELVNRIEALLAQGDSPAATADKPKRLPFNRASRKKPSRSKGQRMSSAGRSK